MSKYEVLRSGEDSLVIDGVEHQLGTVIELSDEEAAPYVEAGQLSFVEEADGAEDELPEEETSSEDASSEDASSEDASSEDASSEDASSEDAPPAGDDVTPGE